MGGLLAAVLLTRLVRGTVCRVTGALAFAATGGPAVAAILQFWLGSLSGSYPANTGAVAMMLIGNPSGTATAPEMLPGWSGALGQLLPPGAGGRLLRSTAFFDGRGTIHAVTVLVAWVGLGAALCLVGGMRARHAAKAAAGHRTTHTSLAETTSAPAHHQTAHR